VKQKTKTKAIHIKIDPKSPLPTYEQIKQALKMAILSGQLEEGSRLSSLREMALKLKVNPNTIIKVYYQLEMEGFIYSRPGAGYFVKIDPSKIKLGKQDLFESITEEYVSKALQLGYPIEDIVDKISKTWEEFTSSETLEEKSDAGN
jgi:DNA-binding transcriptional regulator YhcF (GntR family)